MERCTSDNDFNVHLHSACGLIRGISAELAQVGNALHQVGNDHLANRLANMSAGLDLAEDDLRKAWGNKVHSEFLENQAAAMSILGHLVDAKED